MKHSVIYRYILLLLLSFSISGTMFFYSSFLVRAENVIIPDFSLNGQFSGRCTDVRNYGYLDYNPKVIGTQDFNYSLDPDQYYNLSFDYFINLANNYKIDYFHTYITATIGSNNYIVFDFKKDSQASKSQNFDGNFDFIVKGSDLVDEVVFTLYSNGVVQSTTTVQVNCSFSVSNIILSPLVEDNSADILDAYYRGFGDGLDQGVQEGYDLGYNDGYNVGYGDGVDDAIGSGSGGGFTQADIDNAYNSGYNAGYTIGYDSGYSSGYDAGKSDGFEEGYIAGFNAAKSSAGSGADKVGTTPVLELEINGSKLGQNVTGPTFTSSVIHDMQDSVLGDTHGHAVLSPFYSISGLDFYNDTLLQGDVNCTLNMYIEKYMYEGVAGLEIVYAVPHLNNIEIYSPDGQRLGYDVDYSIENRSDEYKVSINLSIHLNDSYYGGNILIRPYITVNCFGPVLAPVTVEYGGFISSSTLKYYIAPADLDDPIPGSDELEDSNDRFSDGLNNYQDQEGSLFESVSSGLDDFSFFDFESAPAMLSGMSFVGAIMTGWFDAAGGVSGVGIVLSILFSIIIASMGLGLYRWYQSRGK